MSQRGPRYVTLKGFVVVLATSAVLGALLPYIELPLEMIALGSKQVKEMPPGKAGLSRIEETWLWEEREVAVVDVVPTGKAREEFQRAGGGVITAATLDQLQPYTYFTITRTGWPFRALYEWNKYVPEVEKKLVQLEPYPVLNKELGWLGRYSPRRIPRGILWRGVAGNSFLTMTLSSVIYWGFSYLRARRRIGRGMCWNCNYLCTGAVICPECGKAQPIRLARES